MNMLEVRRRAIIAAASGEMVLPTYTGTYNLVGDTQQGYIELLTDGTLTLAPWAYDLCLVGGGQGGGGNGYYNYSGPGGNGGRVYENRTQQMEGDYPCTIGAGGAGVRGREGTPTTGALGTASTLGSMSSASGAIWGNGGSAVHESQLNKVINGNAGSAGRLVFGETGNPVYAGGGGSGGYASGSGTAVGGAGGSGGGGGGGTGKKYFLTNGSAGTANTGGGGGGAGGSSTSDTMSGGAGGSGIILIRWGY